MKKVIIRQSDESIQYGMEENGEIIATASVLLGEDGAYCEAIEVEENHRNNGIGTAFLKALADEHDSIVVAPDNEDAQRLYDRLGYDITDKGDWYIVDQGFGVYEIR